MVNGKKRVVIGGYWFYAFCEKSKELYIYTFEDFEKLKPHVVSVKVDGFNIFFEETQKWANENCKGYWFPWGILGSFYFTEPNDALLFKLVFGGQ